MRFRTSRAGEGSTIDSSAAWNVGWFLRIHEVWLCTPRRWNADDVGQLTAPRGSDNTSGASRGGVKMEMRPPLEIDDYDDMNVCDRDGCLVAEFIVNTHDRDYIITCVNACHRLGLTAEQLDAGVIDNLVRTVKQFLPEVMSVRPAGNGITKQMNLQSALRPFTQESRDDSNI